VKAAEAAKHGDLVVKLAARHATVEDVSDVLRLNDRTTRALLRHLTRAKRIKVVEGRVKIDRG
jgi:hypothetical protein